MGISHLSGELAMLRKLVHFSWDARVYVNLPEGNHSWDFLNLPIEIPHFIHGTSGSTLLSSRKWRKRPANRPETWGQHCGRGVDQKSYSTRVESAY